MIRTVDIFRMYVNVKLKLQTHPFIKQICLEEHQLWSSKAGKLPPCPQVFQLWRLCLTRCDEFLMCKMSLCCIVR